MSEREPTVGEDFQAISDALVEPYDLRGDGHIDRRTVDRAGAATLRIQAHVEALERHLDAHCDFDEADCTVLRDYIGGGPTE